MGMKTQFKIKQTLYIVLLALGAVLTVFPFLYMVSTSLKGRVYVFEIPPRLIPSNPTLDNFVEAWTSNRFDQYFLNSVVVTLITTLAVLLLASMMAYAFARYKFFGKNILYGMVLFFMILPSMSLIVPQFIVATRLGLLDKLSGLVLLYIAQNIPFNVFLLRGFMEQVPVEIEEAAVMDGASPWRIYLNIIMPLCKPALATSAIFASLGAWDEYVWANTIINNANNRTLPVGIAAFRGVHTTDWGLIFAASLIAVVPVIIIFIALQKYFIKGIVTGAVKG